MFQIYEKERLLKIDKMRIAFFMLFLFMFVITEIGREIYRPYIYSNDIFDFWIADTIGNLTGTITIIFFNLVIVYPRYKKGRLLILIVTIGLICYELFQYLSPRSILDWRDMVATLIAGAISFGLYESICFRHIEVVT